jgi:prolyl oligopeptidase
LPEHEVAVLDGCVAVNKDYLAAIYMRDVVHIIEMRNLYDGKYLWDIDTPIGTVSGISADRNGVDLFYKIASFLHPGTIYRYDFTTNPNTIKVSQKSILLNIEDFKKIYFQNLRFSANRRLQV